MTVSTVEPHEGFGVSAVPRINLAGAVWGHGGIPRYCHELVKQLAGRVTYVPCEVTAAALQSVPLLRQLPLAVRGLDPDVPLHFAKIVGAGVTHFRRLPPTVVTVHDLGFLLWPAERQMFSPAAQFFLHLSFAGLRRAERLIAISALAEHTIVQRLRVPPERIIRVYQGVDHAVFRPRPDARRHVEDRFGIGGWSDWITLLTVGTELPRKHVGALLQVVAHYRQQGRRVRLLKVGGAGGDRWRTETLKHVARLGIADRVLLIDSVEDDDLALLYSAADAYVSASVLADQDAPTLEAMACGTATVIADRAASPDIMGDGGIALPLTASAGAWTATLDAVFADRAYADRLRDSAIRRAARFSWSRTAEETRAVYAELSAGVGARVAAVS